MSDERFTVDDDGIYDTQEKKHFKFIAYDWIDCDIYECCEKLNEQQATIEMYQRRVDKREEQISIIKKHCLKFLSNEQIETIRKELENE